jgi:tripartite motif-containing protein 71
VPTPTATSSPAAGPSPVEFAWSATGAGEGMGFPNALALDPQGRLWVADTGNSRFAIFDPDGTFIEYWEHRGTGVGEFILQRSNGGDGYGAVAFAPDGSFYVLDTGNRRVEHFDKNRKFVASWGAFGQNPGQFMDPIGIAVNATGVIYVQDDIRDVVEWYDKDGDVLGSFDIHPRVSGQFNSSNGTGLALDAQGDIYISDLTPYEVLKFDPTGRLLARIGSAGSGAGDFIGYPGGLAVDAEGRIFVTQGPVPVTNIQIFDSAGQFLAAWGSLGTGDGQFGYAYGILLDGNGSVYVADAGSSRIEKFLLLPPFAPSAPPSPAAP